PPPDAHNTEQYDRKRILVMAIWAENTVHFSTFKLQRYRAEHSRGPRLGVKIMSTQHQAVPRSSK
ncbi:hypothetical protein, partial [Pseudomonas fluorescens]|uniref:hypothetical protein n=1 Tax=Pseudomonas fluorescens TaxID=294 RepID=UPI001CD76C97